MTDTTTQAERKPRKPSIRRVTDLTPYQQAVKRAATIVANEPSVKNLEYADGVNKTMQAAYRAQFGVGEMPPLFGAETPIVEQAPAEGSAEVEQASENAETVIAVGGRRGRAAA